MAIAGSLVDPTAVANEHRLVGVEGLWKRRRDVDARLGSSRNRAHRLHTAKYASQARRGSTFARRRHNRRPNDARAARSCMCKAAISCRPYKASIVGRLLAGRCGRRLVFALRMRLDQLPIEWRRRFGGVIAVKAVDWKSAIERRAQQRMKLKNCGAGENEAARIDLQIVCRSCRAARRLSPTENCRSKLQSAENATLSSKSVELLRMPHSGRS